MVGLNKRPWRMGRGVVMETRGLNSFAKRQLS